MIAATPPDPTAEYDALTPAPGESPMEALARVGDTLVREVNPTNAQPDTSRPRTKLPKQLAALVALRAQGFDNQEIADKLQVDVRKVRQLVSRARKVYGWCDLGETIAHVAVPQAVANLIKHLDHEGTPEAIKDGRSTMTRRTLDGTGLFRTHTAVKQETKTEETRILRVELVLPTLPAGAPPVTGVFATPRQALPDLPVPSQETA